METCTSCCWFVAGDTTCGLHNIVLWQPHDLRCDDHHTGVPELVATPALTLHAVVTVCHPEYRDMADDTIAETLGTFDALHGWDAAACADAVQRAADAAQARHDAAFAARQQARIARSSTRRRG